MAVCADLRALNITMDNGLRSHDAGFAPGQGRASFPMAPPSNKFIARSLSNPRNFYSNSPPPGLSSTPQNMYTSNAANFPHQMVPERPLSQPMDSPGNSISRRPSWSPGLQPPRPATAIGIPGVLGEGIYKLSRIGSTTRKRRVNKSWRIPSLGSPGFYTVPKHFDRTLGKEDIVMSLGSPLFRDDGPPRPRSQNAIPSLTRDDSRPSEEYEYLRSDYDPIRGQAGELLGPSMRNASMLETASQPTGQKTETPGHVQPTRVSDGLLSSEPSSQHSTDTSWGSRTSHLHPRPTFFDGVAGKHHRVASSQQRVAASTTSQSCGNTFATQPGQILPQNYDTSGMDDALLRVVEINQEGLSKATKLWNDLMERGQKATEAIESSDEAYNIFLKYGEEWAKKLDDIAASTAQKMRKARHRKEA
ncbi:hypothetical protein B0T25DRAFT_260233 [Lasiosphaeria hispida]|uniref:Uncharacterized protein n=1 Tax=Lasiosphaeria hispida TaxID=260671 RepID=A0AAJ0HFZ0_9PEZI|nr:hypothetical protein B0T25DRAFT_260233 [Lasiosphaeria hispida]